MSALSKFFPVSEQQKDDILKEFGKTRQDVADDIKIIREWLKKQPQIPEIKEDSFIEKVLVRNKCRIEKTKTKIDSYFTSKNVYRDFYASFNPCRQELVALTKYTFNIMMPKLTPNNSRIHFWTLRLSKDDEYDAKAIVQHNALMNETQFLYDDCPSIVAIFDAKGFGMAQALKADLNNQSKMMKVYLEAFSGRMEAMHTVNVSPAAERAINLLKPMLPFKVRDRLFFHSTFESLHTIIPKDCLPSEVGGTGPSAIELSKEMAEALRSDVDNIMKRNEIATNESLRVGKPPIEVDLFGVDGTFKKISID